jgi:hypothetical protein
MLFDLVCHCQYEIVTNNNNNNNNTILSLTLFVFLSLVSFQLPH